MALAGHLNCPICKGGGYYSAEDGYGKIFNVTCDCLNYGAVTNPKTNPGTSSHMTCAGNGYLMYWGILPGQVYKQKLVKLCLCRTIVLEAVPPTPKILQDGEVPTALDLAAAHKKRREPRKPADPQFDYDFWPGPDMTGFRADLLIDRKGKHTGEWVMITVDSDKRKQYYAIESVEVAPEGGDPKVRKFTIVARESQ